MAAPEPVIATDEIIATEDENKVFDEDKVEQLEVSKEDVTSSASSSFDFELVDVSRYYEFCARQKTDVIYLLGDSECGKTTFEAVLYGLFCDGVNQDILFAGSRTLTAFERRRQAVAAVGDEVKQEAIMPRTRRSRVSNTSIFLHMEICKAEDMERKKHILLSDIPGEDYEGCSKDQDMIEQKLPLIENATHIVVVIEAGKLMNLKTRNFAVMRANHFLMRLKNSGRYHEKVCVDIVVSKCDTIPTDVDKRSFVNTICEQINPYGFQMEFFWIESMSGLSPKFSKSTDIMSFFKYLVEDHKEEEPMPIHMDEITSGLSDNCNLLWRRWGNGRA